MIGLKAVAAEYCTRVVEATVVAAGAGAWRCPGVAPGDDLLHVRPIQVIVCEDPHEMRVSAERDIARHFLDEEVMRYRGEEKQRFHDVHAGAAQPR